MTLEQVWFTGGGTTKLPGSEELPQSFSAGSGALSRQTQRYGSGFHATATTLVYQELHPDSGPAPRIGVSTRPEPATTSPWARAPGGPQPVPVGHAVRLRWGAGIRSDRCRSGPRADPRAWASGVGTGLRAAPDRRPRYARAGPCAPTGVLRCLSDRPSRPVDRPRVRSIIAPARRAPGGPCRCSSVVERTLGKGEVEGSSPSSGSVRAAAVRARECPIRFVERYS